MINCDYFIIWMWIAWIWLKYKLVGNVILVDKNPLSYKVWESHIPNLLHADFSIFEKIAPKLYKNLESYQLKKWTIFSDSSKNLYENSAYTELHDLYAFHSDRVELENMLINELNIDYKKEEVLDINFDKNIVYTDKNTYNVWKYILDCSWSRMFIANKLWLVDKIPNWDKTFAIWWYWNVLENDIYKWKVDDYTLLNKINNNTWIWTIPLFWWKILSSGIVSTDKLLSEEKYFWLVEKYKHPYYSKITKVISSTNIWKIYRRNNYAKLASQASSKNYILLWDAYCFADPVFSVWTWISISEAIYIANMLNKSEFNYKEYNKKSQYLISTLLWNFTSWYDDGWKKNYIMSDIQNNSLQWWILNKTLWWLDNTLETYFSLISSFESEYLWSHEINNLYKNTAIVFFHEWLYSYWEGVLKIWYHWINSEKIEVIVNKNIIKFFNKLKFKILTFHNIISLWKKYFNSNDFNIFIIHLNNLKINRAIPIYYKNSNE